MTDTVLLKGKSLATQVLAHVSDALAGWAQEDFSPRLVSVLASDDPASQVYAQAKARRAGKLGVRYEVLDLGADATQRELDETLARLSASSDVHGIMLELPLAPQLDAVDSFLHLSRRKDIEGLTPANLSRLAAGQENSVLLPPTPRSVRYLLRQAFDNDLKGKRVAVIGPGRTVGRPLVWMLNNFGVTVTLVNEHTRDLTELLRPQDAVVVAVGRRGLLRAEQVQPHHVVIDAGINVTETGVVGDATPEVAQVVRAITPVPGGVGPLTSALMYQNMVRAVQLQRGETLEEHMLDLTRA
ncbi:bifunctional protein FolD [Deinococcus piscis]|uniref:Bifunctional protein FolD n=1 Tax=Deinococcus piscis TaxID=394230 RepID=A0ABQ3K729_9DEIO|nr:bifunctional 5,10-methylenetetrahydrofolate dehydrogenase/5,10-methenyltetrahydrofolate cyclohydrolase [Deinococcus piscis]GHG02022.1 bifunctional protein FolD [Deinococcus piscis]